jgi:hypothetical protein
MTTTNGPLMEHSGIDSPDVFRPASSREVVDEQTLNGLNIIEHQVTRKCGIKASAGPTFPV